MSKPMPDAIKVAGVQMEPRILDKEGNLRKVLEGLEAAAREGARLAVFPECALTGYCFRSLAEALPWAEPVPGPSTERIARECRRLGLYAIVGMLESDGGVCYNAAALVGPEGVAGRYRKAHLPYLGVDRFVEPGDEPFRVHRTGAGALGILICYDLTFPEASRTLALDGAELVCLPTNWPKKREKMPQCVVPTRALESKVNYIAVNRVGRERGFTFIGRSRIVDPLGNVLAEAGPDREEIIVAEVDLAAARSKRTVYAPGEFETDVIGHRRPELYHGAGAPPAAPKRAAPAR